MWLGLILARCHLWDEFVVAWLWPCFEGFSLVSPVFLPPQKPKSSNSNLTRIVDLHENQLLADVASLNVVIYFIQIIETGSSKVLLASSLFDIRVHLPVCVTAPVVISHWSRNCCKRPSWPLTQCPRWVSKRGQWRKRISALPCPQSLFNSARPHKLIPHYCSHKMTV